MNAETVSRPHWALGPLRRWPTAVALAAGTASVIGMNIEAVSRFAEIAFILQLEYMIIARIGLRKASWPVVLVLAGVVTATQFLEVSTAAVLVGLSAAVLVWGALKGEAHRPGPFRVQVLGAIGFGALAAIGLAVDPDVGRYVVAAAWFFHGVWDVVHHRLDRVVSRSYAEACAVLDFMVAAGLLFLL
ncbi:hypothetical protein GCM10029992_34860 [Glycomyces albus]